MHSSLGNCSSAAAAVPTDSDSPHCNGDDWKNNDGVARLGKASPFGQLLDKLRKEAEEMGIWDEEMHRDLPKRWEKHADMIILPCDCFRNSKWRIMGRRLWELVAESLRAGRLGRKRLIDDDPFDSVHIDLLLGKDGWVENVNSGIRFHYDVTKRAFNINNLTEMQRIASMECEQEVIVDMFAGIGYFTLAFLINAHAKHVYAVDWNEDALEALLRAIQDNHVEDRCTLIQGDSRKAAPYGVADRVNMALLPTSRAFWLAASRCLKASGGIVHIHEAVHIPLREAPAKLAINKRRLLQSTRLTSSEDVLSVSEDSMEEDSCAGVTTNNSFDVDGPSVGQLASDSGTFEARAQSNGHADTGRAEEEPSSEHSVRKIGRAASIIEELEGRILPEAQIDENFKLSRWEKVHQRVQWFALDCANSFTRYLNNIHDEAGKVWACVVTDVSTVRIYSSSERVVHVVVDLTCRPQNDKTP